MPFEEIEPRAGLYRGVRTLRFTGPADGSELTVVLSSSILTVAHRGLMTKRHPALSPTDDGLPATAKRQLDLIKRGEVLAQRQLPEPDEAMIAEVIGAIPILTTIAVGHPVRLCPLVPGCEVKFIELGVVVDWPRLTS